MKKKRGFKDVGLAILLLLFLASCGGGGGGSSSGGGGGSSSGISYTGLTTQATVDENNAEELSIGAYSGGYTGSAIGGTLGVIQTERCEPEGYPRVLKVAQTLKDTLDKLDFTSRTYGTFVGEIYTESDTIYGSCGGSAFATITIDDQTGYFSGRMNVNKYCDMEITISGVVDLSGKVDVYAEEITEFTMSFDNLTSTSASDSVTAKGDISLVNVTAYGGTMVINMTMQDNSTKETFRLVDYQIVVAEQFDSIGIDISGRYYDPNYGYVDLSTPTLFRIYEGNWNPSEGVLVVKGKTAIGGGSTKARLTALSSSAYKVEADTDGDGLYDYDTGALYWPYY